MGRLVYFSCKSQTTRRFIDKLGVDALSLALDGAAPPPELSEPYILLTPTYGGGGLAGAVPKSVIGLLNHPRNRSLLRGVIASGNINFGPAFALAGKIIAAKCSVPLLYRFELSGTTEDVRNVKQGLERFWTR